MKKTLLTLTLFALLPIGLWAVVGVGSYNYDINVMTGDFDIVGATSAVTSIVGGNNTTVTQNGTAYTIASSTNVTLANPGTYVLDQSTMTLSQLTLGGSAQIAPNTAGQTIPILSSVTIAGTITPTGDILATNQTFKVWNSSQWRVIMQGNATGTHISAVDSDAGDGIYYHKLNQGATIFYIRESDGWSHFGGFAPVSKLTVSSGVITADGLNSGFSTTYGISAATGAYSGQVTSNGQKLYEKIPLDFNFAVFQSTNIVGTTAVRVSPYRDAVDVSTYTLKMSGYGGTGKIVYRTIPYETSVGTAVISGVVTISTSAWTGGTLTVAIPDNSALFYEPATWLGGTITVEGKGYGYKH